ncbi:heavy metal-associated isoprenylated plant protein 47-like [Heracleum sosnowskyi]|uniref:Heavy metal-associated isoprenylated plant protein 47-like n=1 Tax=Heracleum sosnowskyi TaxID=360622 RepID=A0AAD8IQP5_9APIA|nr:heavy metal-associated isoprenylated plant protein 47-like [Heracleum sosnowskyi]KAK1389186.1 heavy metal-associated isoprenylated plant protein 47-like [Heracleum sosnowskyi]
MKQKVVIKVAMCSPKKSRVKAMKIAATSYGVEAVALKGDDKDQIEVIGEGIDTIELAKSLRKYVGRADVVSVGPFNEEKIEEKTNENKDPVPICSCGYTCPPSSYGPAPCYYEPCRDPSCSIM